MSAPLRVWWLLAYLTETEGLTWRDADYTTNKIVKALKGDAINGYFRVKIGDQWKSFDQSNIQEFMPTLFRAVATKLNELVTDDFDLVPIPNSSATIKDKGDFKTLSYARSIAEAVGSRATAVPALRWKEAKVSARKGGPRDPQLHCQNFALSQKPAHQVVLFDDVLTSGSQLIGACRRLAVPRIRPAFAIVIARTVHEQLDKMIGWRCEDIETEEIPIDLSDIF